MTRSLTAPVFPGVEFLAPDDAGVATFLAGRAQVVAATGHRPDKFPPRAQTTLPPLPATLLGTKRQERDPFGVYTARGWAALVALASELLGEMRADAVVAGGALGWDQVVMEAALGRGLPCLLAVPFETQAALWPDYARAIWLRHAQAAEVAVCVTPVTAILAPGARTRRDLDVEKMRRAMSARNRFMVRSAQAVLAFHNGSSGGTGNCLRDVRAARQSVLNAWDRLRERHAR